MKAVDLLTNVSFQHFFLSILVVVGGMFFLHFNASMKDVIVPLISAVIFFYFGRNGVKHENGTAAKS